MNAKNYILYSGGAQGSESEFGKLAEKFGLPIINNFTLENTKSSIVKQTF